MKSLLAAAAAIASLAGCATELHADNDPPVRQPTDSCRAEPAQRYVGQKISAEVGAVVLRATGASELRWLGPGMIITLEYKYGRVGISYDARGIITRVSCG